MKHIALFMYFWLLSGCAHTLGYGGAHPGRITCTGKGVITLTGSGNVSVGSAEGTMTINADCGEKGFTLQQDVPKN